MVHLKKNLIPGLFVFIFALNGYSSNYKYKIEKRDNSVTIYQDSSIIQIEIIDKSIIHVKKMLNKNAISTIPDYVTVLEPQKSPWKISEKKKQVIINTESLTIIVNSNGTIEYQTKENKKLVAETNELTFIKTNNAKGNTVSQAFLAGDEAIYGLGQFQSGIMNWKNVPIRLQQENQEISIPFIVSTNNYGIYWNNYSVTDFNIPGHEISFSTMIDEEKKIRETSFSPDKSGIYTFMLESNSQNIRSKNCKILVNIEGDTIINYSTFWAPVCYSGKKYLEAGKAYNVIVQNTNSGELGKLFYNEPDYNKTVFSSSAGNTIDYYFVYGANPAVIISQYQRLTGKSPMLAKSVFGFWQCRERYHNQAELLENGREYRKRQIPVDNIVQDWFYWPEGTKGPEWDRAKYPNPKAMVNELDSLNLQLMVSVWPEVKNEPLLKKYGLSEYGMEKTNYLDFTAKLVQENYYKMLSDSMFHFGVSSIWLDGTEPENKPANDFQTAVGPFGEVANCYSLLVTKAMYEGKRKEYPNERVFNLTRSAYAGQQRYGVASWSGDVAGTWKQFSEQIAAGLNFVMAGVPYWNSDIGGFFRDSVSLNRIYDNQYTNKEYIELLTRWFQFGTFNPIFRIHGYKSNTEIWRYGQEFENMARKFIDIRYQLMPYIYSETWKVTNEGKLLMSPLVYQSPNDKNTWKIKDQFFLGDALLVCPVTEYLARTKDVYLPEGNWYNFWTNEKLKGGNKVLAKAPLDELPLYVKEGSILPMGPKVQYATQKTNEPLHIKIYPGKNAEYVLYLDDNESFQYEEGIYSEIIFTYSESNRELKIKNGSDTYINFNQNPMELIIEMIGVEKEEKVNYSGIETQVKF